jgi:heme oxygenase
MSLKEITAERHGLAENTVFMKTVFDRSISPNAWTDFLYQKWNIYHTIETKAKFHDLITGLEGLIRGPLLYQDYENNVREYRLSYSKLHPVVQDYTNYIAGLDSNVVLAHVYTWHLGDIYGGQMIKKLAPGSHLSLEFENAHILAAALRAKLDDSLGDEANTAFDWAIKILKTYDDRCMEKNQ